MRIIYPVPELLPDQRARFIQIMQTCEALAKLGTEVILMAGIRKGYSEEAILSFYGLSEHPNLKLVRIPIMRREQKKHLRFSSHWVFHFFLLVRLLLNKSYRDGETVFFVRHIKLSDLVLRCRKFLRAAVVFEVHEIFHLAAHGERSRERLKRAELGVYSEVDALVSISQAIKEYLIQMGIPGGSIHVVRNGVEKEWFSVRQEPSASYICYTGSLYPWKGVDTLILAMKHLPGEKLVIVGGGGRMEVLKSLTVKEAVSDRVDFAGAVPRRLVPGYLSHSKVAVLPNILSMPSQFSSPLKLFEYMACGVPIAASDMPVFREVLTHKENAVLVEPNNPEALAEGVRFLIENPDKAAQIAWKAKNDALDFTYEKRAEKIVDVIERMRREK
jgi:glycosyltransferase involved in cell wall biosynthesis